jgi:eukaryotic-like serine/threonine-protein kinase
LFSWLPDNRHIILSFQDKADVQQEHLWIADVDSGVGRAITSGASWERDPALSPDGKKLLFVQFRRDSAFVSLSLKNAVAERIASSEMEADMPAWAMRRQQYAYLTTRNGPPEIWVRGEGRDQPVVTPASFSAGTTNSFMTPALSPGADRLIYTRLEAHGPVLNWISSVSGGPPVRLTNDSNASEYGGSWSPDGKSFAYFRYLNRRADVMIVKATGEAKPVLLRANIGDAVPHLPQWSPDEQWIIFFDREGGKGWTLISADGKTERALGLSDALEMTFSSDSSLLYGIRRLGREPTLLWCCPPEQGRGSLFSLDLATMRVKNIGELARDFTPRSGFTPGMRLSLAPDGKSILYPVARFSGSLWMLEGFE